MEQIPRFVKQAVSYFDTLATRKANQSNFLYFSNPAEEKAAVARIKDVVLKGFETKIDHDMRDREERLRLSGPKFDRLRELNQNSYDIACGVLASQFDEELIRQRNEAIKGKKPPANTRENFGGTDKFEYVQDFFDTVYFHLLDQYANKLAYRSFGTVDKHYASIAVAYVNANLSGRTDNLIQFICNALGLNNKGDFTRIKAAFNKMHAEETEKNPEANLASFEEPFLAYVEMFYYTKNRKQAPARVKECLAERREKKRLEAVRKTMESQVTEFDKIFFDLSVDVFNDIISEFVEEKTDLTLSKEKKEELLSSFTDLIDIHLSNKATDMGLTPDQIKALDLPDYMEKAKVYFEKNIDNAIKAVSQSRKYMSSTGLDFSELII